MVTETPDSIHVCCDGLGVKEKMTDTDSVSTPPSTTVNEGVISVVYFPKGESIGKTFSFSYRDNEDLTYHLP